MVSLYRWKLDKGKSRNGCYKKRKRTKFSEKQTFLTTWCAYQVVRNVCFSENLKRFVFLQRSFWDLPSLPYYRRYVYFPQQFLKQLRGHLLIYQFINKGTRMIKRISSKLTKKTPDRHFDVFGRCRIIILSLWAILNQGFILLILNI